MKYFSTREEKFRISAWSYPPYNEKLQLNLSTMATLQTEESGHCKEVAIVESCMVAR